MAFVVNNALHLCLAFCHLGLKSDLGLMRLIIIHMKEMGGEHQGSKKFDRSTIRLCKGIITKSTFATIDTPDS